MNLIKSPADQVLLREALEDVRYEWSREARRLVGIFPDDATTYREKCEVLDRMIEELKDG